MSLRNTARDSGNALRRFARRAREASRPSRIYLVSVAGCPNYGDEYIARSWLQFLAKHRPDAEVWLDCPDPGRAAAFLYGIHPRLHTTSTLWELSRQTSGNDSRQIGDYVRERVRNFGSPAVDIGIEILRGSHILHAIGGGYINDLWPAHVGVLAGLVEARAISGARLYTTGIGFLPMRESNLGYLADLLGEFDHAEARDSASSDALGVAPGCDDAFLGLNWEPPPGRSADAPEVMVLIQGDFTQPGQDAALRAAALGFVRRHCLHPGGRGVGFVEAIPPVDARCYLALAGELPEASFFPFGHIWNHGIPFKPGQVWLTSRFHMHLLAAAQGCAGVALSLDPDYYAIKHQSLLALGSGWSLGSALDVQPHGELPEPTLAPDFAARSRSLAGQKLALARSLYRR